ncbi:UNVERIFIED_ORG: adenylate/guanylate cyclase [Burkholderia sp. CF145]
MRCLQCGAENNPARRFCMNCGVGLPRACPACAFVNESASRYCGGCGKPIETSDVSRPAQIGVVGTPLSPTAQAEAERRQLTVMFCDVVGSTKLAAYLDPEVMLELISAYQHTVTGEIQRFGGYLAKYMGDGILAYFGYPQAHEDDAARAAQAGLDIIEAICASNTHPDRAGGAELAVRVGIATGVVVVGEIVGTGLSEEASVVGATPNLAARLQGIAGPNEIVIAEGTRRLAGGAFAYRDLGPQHLKGLEEPVAAFQVLNRCAIGTRFEARLTRRLTPMIGRREELTLLQEQWDRAKRGEAQVCLVSGDPGIGKSRLLQALRESISEEPHFELRLQCSLDHVNSSLHPHIEQLERAAMFERGDSPEVKLNKLENLLAKAGQFEPEYAALLAALLSIPSGQLYRPLELSPVMQKQRTMEALISQLLGLAHQQPVLLVFEDTHWADPTSLELLDLIVCRLPGAAVMTLITTRPERVLALPALSYVSMLQLSRLCQGDAAVMCRQLAGGIPLPDALTASIVARTDGVPLFIEELTSMLVEETETGTVSQTEMPTTVIPMTLQDLLMERLDRLAKAKRVAQIGATIGRDFSFELLSEVAGINQASLRSALDGLVQSGLVLPHERSEMGYRFKHALVQEAAYNSMLRGPRRQLHSRIADALMSHFADLAMAQPETIARHLTDAERWAEAGAHWLSAGQLALRRGAHTEAIAQFNKGLAVIERMPESTARVRSELALQAALGPTLKVTKGPGHPEFGRVQAAAFELCCQLEDRPGLFSITFSLCLFYWAHGELSKANNLAVELLTMAEGSGTGEYMMNAEMLTSMIRLHRGDPFDARQRLERAVAAYDPAQHQELYPTYLLDVGVFGRFYLALACSALGDFDQAAVHARDALDLARVLRQPHSYGFALLANFITETWRGDWLKTHDFASECIAYSSEQGFPEFVALAQICRGWARLQPKVSPHLMHSI